MRFFKRGDSEAQAPADFWAWWSGGRDRVARAISTGGFDERLVGEITKAVHSIHPAMAWELAPGKTAEHAFCISPEGNAEIRQAALAWLGSAPPPDATWEYYASKQAAPKLMGLEIGSARFDLEEMRTIASWDEARQRVDVHLWHPGFSGAPDQVRLQVGFIFLDNLLGEDDVERWIGEIDLLDAPSGGRTPAELKAEVERRKTDQSDDETWILGERTSPDGSVAIVVADAGLKRIDHPFADHHVTIQVLWGANRMPTEAEAAVLNEQEDDLLRRVEGVTIYAGRVTEPGSRTLHFATHDPGLMRPAIDEWAQNAPDSLGEGLPQLRVKVNFERDMDWSFQRELGVR